MEPTLARTPDETGGHHWGQISGVMTLWSDDSDTVPESQKICYVTDKWYRLVWRVDLTNRKMDFWVDGKQLAYDCSNPTVLVPDRCLWALEPDGVIILSPYNGVKRRIARLAFWDYYISNEEIISLGIAGDPTTADEQ
jgi:hypothetical protein